MLSRPTDVSDRGIADALRAHWHIDTARITYEPVGFGAHHWRADDSADRPWFVTVDDLSGKPWLGTDPALTLDELERAYATAAELRDECRLEFVVSPMPSRDGHTVHLLTDHWAISVMPYVNGRAGSFGDAFDAESRRQLAGALARLHAAAPTTCRPRQEDEGKWRGSVTDLLASTDEPWEGGPWSEAARGWCREHEGEIEKVLSRHEALEAECWSNADAITHGEPHPGNVVMLTGTDTSTATRMALIDWDTVAVARPERDVWLAAGGSTGRMDGAFLHDYEQAAGRQLDWAALEVARLTWTLADVASLSSELKGEHERSDDSDATWRYLRALRLEARNDPPNGGF